MRSRDARFLGHGNFVFGEGHCRTPAWKLTCARCQDIKVVAMPNGDMPPSALIKKFAQAGWSVGKRAAGDVCAECQKKHKPVAAPVQSSAAEASEIERQKAAVAALHKLRAQDNERNAKLLDAALHKATEDQALLEHIHALLCAGQVDAARQAIEARLPNVKKAAPPPSQIAKRDDAFDEWLNNLDKRHRAAAKRSNQ